MPTTFEQKTIRDPLLGMVADQLGKGHINCGLTQQVGCELVALLSAYREEDQRLFPQVYLFGLSRTDLIRALAPGIPVLEIRVEADDQTTPRRAAVMALKTCASLAIDGWCVYIRREEEGFSFGYLLNNPEDGYFHEALRSISLARSVIKEANEGI